MPNSPLPQGAKEAMGNDIHGKINMDDQGEVEMMKQIDPPHGIQEPWKTMKIYEGQDPCDSKTSDDRTLEKQLDKVIIEKMRQCLDQEESAIAKMRECLNEKEKAIMERTNGTTDHQTNHEPSGHSTSIPKMENSNMEGTNGTTHSRPIHESTEHSTSIHEKGNSNMDGTRGTTDRQPTHESTGHSTSIRKTENMHSNEESFENNNSTNQGTMDAVRIQGTQMDNSLDGPETFNLDKLNDGSGGAQPFGNIHEIVAQMRGYVNEEESARIGDDDHSKVQHENRLKEIKANIEESIDISKARAAKEDKELQNENIEPKHEEESSDPHDNIRQSSDKGTCINEIDFHSDEKNEKIKMSSTSGFTHGEKDEEGYESDNDDTDSAAGASDENAKKKKEAKGFMKKMKGLLSTKD